MAYERDRKSVSVCVGGGQGHMRVCERLKCVETVSPWQQSERGRGGSEGLCGLAPVANGLRAADELHATRDVAAY